MATEEATRPAMWTILALTCKRCDGEIPLRVNALDVESMKAAAVRLFDLMAIHLQRVHVVEEQP